MIVMKFELLKKGEKINYKMSHGLYCFSVVKGSLYKSKLKPLKSLRETDECVLNINGAARKSLNP